MAEFNQILRTRRSIRRYTRQPVARDVIDQLLEAAGWAPSFHHRQPWRWAVVTAPETKARLAGAMGERLRHDRLAAGETPEAVAPALARSYARLTAAPALIVACSSLAGGEALPDTPAEQAQERHMERLMAAQSVAAAIQNLLLAAQAAGLGACWVCAPLYCPEVVRQALDLPQDWEAQALITLGYAAEAEATAPAPRRPWAETVVYR